jgi:ribosomal-protein-alanine N-acetyltransferase
MRVFALIETNRLVLRSMKQSDLDAIIAIFSDKNVLKAFNLKSLSDEQIKRWINRNLEHQKKYGYGLYSVVLKSNNEVIGDCGLEHTDFMGTPCAEIGYDFMSKYWNQGYASEAAYAIRDYAIKVLKIDSGSLCSFIRKNNVASQRVSEKIGMHNILEYSENGIDYYLYAFSEKLVSTHNR